MSAGAERAVAEALGAIGASHATLADRLTVATRLLGEVYPYCPPRVQDRIEATLREWGTTEHPRADAAEAFDRMCAPKGERNPGSAPAEVERQFGEALARRGLDLYESLDAAHRAAFGCGAADGYAARDALDDLVRRTTGRLSFLDLVSTDAGYRPTLASEGASRPLADAYDAFQAAVGDPRRAERRPAAARDPWSGRREGLDAALREMRGAAFLTEGDADDRRSR